VQLFHKLGQRSVVLFVECEPVPVVHVVNVVPLDVEGDPGLERPLHHGLCVGNALVAKSEGARFDTF
jgi:hypothetical protein